MLELIHDNRSGAKLEIVLPTLNEEARAVQLVEYYAPWFDVVILDDGSADATVVRVIEAGGTVYRRTVKKVPAEAHFAHYLAALTRSGRCFWMFADEFVSAEDMAEIAAALESKELKSKEAVVSCRRVNYVFGQPSATLTSVGARGFTPGTVTYSADNLHSSLRVSGSAYRHPGVFDVHHLHLYSVRNYFGTIGSYTYFETEQMRRLGWPKAQMRFFRRFAVTLGAFVFLRARREKQLPRRAVLVLSLERLITLLLAVMSWLEQSHLPSLDQQKAEYAKFFNEKRSDKVQ